MSGELGRPAAELDDAELEAQGTQAHATRNHVFLHGTAEQFARHTSRMLELEQEYLRRHPHRTWQGSGGAGSGRPSEIDALRESVRAIAAQLDALVADRPSSPAATPAASDPVLLVLSAVAAAPDGRMHKLALHQAAREAGVDRTTMAGLYTGDPPLLAAEQHDRVLTESGRARLRAAGLRSRAPAAAGSGPTAWAWTHQEQPRWDADKQRIIGGVAPGTFALVYGPGDPVAGDWWTVADDTGQTLGLGWLDVNWGEAEIAVAVDPDARQRGLGSFVLDRLEQEAAERGLNYAYNTVRTTNPRRDELVDWLTARGYEDSPDSPVLRKRVGLPPPAVAPRSAPAAPPPVDARPGGTDLGPGREDSGGYVDVDDHRY